MQVLPEQLKWRHHLPRWFRLHLQTAVFVGPALQYANIKSQSGCMSYSPVSCLIRDYGTMQRSLVNDWRWWLAVETRFNYDITQFVLQMFIIITYVSCWQINTETLFSQLQLWTNDLSACVMLSWSTVKRVILRRTKIKMWSRGLHYIFQKSKPIPGFVFKTWKCSSDAKKTSAFAGNGCVEQTNPVVSQIYLKETINKM